jgi:ribosomal protein S27AE
MGVNCPFCNRELKDGAKFCGFCGKSNEVQPRETAMIEPEKVSKSESQPLFQPYLCARCRNPLKYVDQYSKWYCSRCNSYDFGSIQYPQQTTFFCSRCGETLTFANQYNKWFCSKCHNYTLELNHFYLDPDEIIDKNFYNFSFSTNRYTRRLVKNSSWQDLGTITVTNKSIIFGGSKFWLKTGAIQNIASEYLSNLEQVSSSQRTGSNQWYWIKVVYQDPASGLNNIAFFGSAGGNNENEVRGNTDQFYNYVYNWWKNSKKRTVKKKEPEGPAVPRGVVAPKVEVVKPEKGPEAETEVSLDTEEDGTIIQEDEKGIKVYSAVNYEHAMIVYKVKVENNSKSAISDVCITPYVPRDIFLLDEEDKSIGLIKKGEAITSTFTIRPKGECGNVEIRGDVKYYDALADDYSTIKIKARETKIVCPMLKAIPIKEEQWREIVSPLISVKEITNDVPLSADELFDMISDVIKDMNMYMLKPKIKEHYYKGKFYSEGIKGFKYAVQLEILGGMQNSKLILNAYAENEESLIGCYHKLLDEIEDRTNIKKYIKDALVIKGDYVVGSKEVVSGDKINGSKIQDSVVQRSTIGGGERAEVKDSVVQRSKLDSEDESDEESDVEWKE